MVFFTCLDREDVKKYEMSSEFYLQNLDIANLQLRDVIEFNYSLENALDFLKILNLEKDIQNEFEFIGILNIFYERNFLSCIYTPEKFAQNMDCSTLYLGEQIKKFLKKQKPFKILKNLSPDQKIDILLRLLDLKFLKSSDFEEKDIQKYFPYQKFQQTPYLFWRIPKLWEKYNYKNILNKTKEFNLEDAEMYFEYNRKEYFYYHVLIEASRFSEMSEKKRRKNFNHSKIFQFMKKYEVFTDLINLYFSVAEFFDPKTDLKDDAFLVTPNRLSYVLNDDLLTNFPFNLETYGFYLKSVIHGGQFKILDKYYDFKIRNLDLFEQNIELKKKKFLYGATIFFFLKSFTEENSKITKIPWKVILFLQNKFEVGNLPETEEGMIFYSEIFWSVLKKQKIRVVPRFPYQKKFLELVL